MTDHPFTDPSLTGLLDQFAMNAMQALMTCYAPETLPATQKEIDSYFDEMASHAYYMALSMMDARQRTHALLAHVALEAKADKEEEASEDDAEA